MPHDPKTGGDGRSSSAQGLPAPKARCRGSQRPEVRGRWQPAGIGAMAGRWEPEDNRESVEATTEGQEFELQGLL